MCFGVYNPQFNACTPKTVNELPDIYKNDRSKVMPIGNHGPGLALSQAHPGPGDAIFLMTTGESNQDAAHVTSPIMKAKLARVTGLTAALPTRSYVGVCGQTHEKRVRTAMPG